MKNNSPKHLKSTFTTNLGMFKYHDVNRDFTIPQSQNRIKRIAESMKTEGLLPHPIVVTSKFYVVDGQHRLEAARIAGKGIYFFIDENIPNTSKEIFEAAKRFNRDAKPWSKGDYIHGYSVQGNESYTVLEEFGKKFPMFTLTERLMLLQNSGTKHSDKRAFADGKFNVVDVKTAEKWANYLLELKPYFENGYNKSNFVRTMLTIMEKKKGFKFEEFIHKVKLRPGSIHLCGDKSSYSVMIENIYNYRRREDEKLNLRF